MAPVAPREGDGSMSNAQAPQNNVPALEQPWPWLRGNLGVLASVAGVGISAVLSVNFWVSKDELLLASVAGVCEVISLVTLTFLMRAVERGDKVRVFLCAVLLVSAAGFCLYTNGRALQETSQRLFERSLETDSAYQRAQAAMDASITALNEEMRRAPPSCRCPATITAWSTTRRDRLATLNAQKAQVARDVRDATPRPSQVRVHDLIAAFIELVKLGGLYVYSHASWRSARVSPCGAERPGFWKSLVALATRAFLTFASLGGLPRRAMYESRNELGAVLGGGQLDASLADVRTKSLGELDMSPSDMSSADFREPAVRADLDMCTDMSKSPYRCAGAAVRGDAATARPTRRGMMLDALHMSTAPEASGVHPSLDNGEDVHMSSRASAITRVGAASRGKRHVQLVGGWSKALRLERIKRVQALAQEGAPKAEIARLVGVCRSTVYNDLDRRIE
ncbi:MAG: hypothetical protein JNJ73_03640 [Hyphomonadaceae bacterium]|nr:hypothetical protein [Hyphomonadaceae bacterium]